MWQPVRADVPAFMYFQLVIATTEILISSWTILTSSTKRGALAVDKAFSLKNKSLARFSLRKQYPNKEKYTYWLDVTKDKKVQQTYNLNQAT